MSSDPKEVGTPAASLDSTQPIAASASVASHSGDTAFASSTIMIVDDEPTTIDVLEMFLESEGYQSVVTTSDSREALALLECERPDVLLLDLMMPHVDGLTILKRIRASDQLRHTPVLILTSSTDAETKLQALELGATDFLGKPVDPSELGLRLRNTLSAKAYQDRLAFYDALTNLPNRRLFMERLDRDLGRARTQKTECALLHIDLDRFKQINDAVGHSFGDALLRSVAERIELALKTSDTPGVPSTYDPSNPLSRVGGDEFFLLVSCANATEAAATMARRVVESLAEPFRVGGKELFVTASVGVAVFPEDASGIDDLLANASSAMRYAKARGRNGFQFYHPSLDDESEDRLNLETELRGAIERKELEMYYQPKVQMETGRIVGCEALMRWNHPELGMVPPDRFIPIAEDADLIGALGDWALRTACQESRRWQDSGLRPISVAVNVSARQFMTGDIVSSVKRAIQDSDIAPERLTVELTESLIVENATDTSRMLMSLRDMGVKIAIDDFGTGYSSLASLKRFPIDELKIDRSFIQEIPENADDAALVLAVIAFARVLGLIVVAEGIETEEQRSFLAGHFCDIYQGYLCSPAVPGEEMRKLLAAQR